MRKLSGEYFQEGQVKTYDFQVASTWSELTDGQFQTGLMILANRKAGKSVKASALLTLLFGKNWLVLNHFDEEQLYELVKLTDFLLKTLPPTINRHQVLTLNGKIYNAPAQDLNNISFGEWCFLYQAWYNYSFYEDPVSLDKLIAILYRPTDPEQKPGSPSFTGDIRETFNENNIELRAQIFEKINPGQKQAILAWFTTAILSVMALRPHVFPESNKADVSYSDNVADENRTWFSIFRELLGPKWGTEKQLKFTNAMFVLDGLEEQQIEFERAKSKL